MTEPITFGLTGIVNTANTCYMNSAIQCLSHTYPITAYFFNNKEDIMRILKSNARSILKDMKKFQLTSATSHVSMDLREKIQNPNYDASMLTPEEETIVLNHTMTFQLIRLLESMWKVNCSIVPTSFRKIFTEARDKFFAGNEQHDSEEAYSCIVQQMQEELAERKKISLKTTKTSVKDLLAFQNSIQEQIRKTSNRELKEQLLASYQAKKKAMPTESLIIESFREMKNYYSRTHSRITNLFSGFLHSSITCPKCDFSSNKFDPFLLLSLPIPIKTQGSSELNINDCMLEFCRQETLDEQNLYHCSGCDNNVPAIKTLRIWECPSILVISLKRFSMMQLTKDSRRIEYPLVDLDISSMISPCYYDKTKCYKYTLQCVINHTGSRHGGHYFSYCRDEDSGEWYSFNDASITKIQTKAAVTTNAYLLFYIRNDMFSE